MKNIVKIFSSFALITAVVLHICACGAGKCGGDLSGDITKNPVTGKDADEVFLTSQWDFAAEIFRQSAAEKGENALVSPLSVMIALAMTANGAEGETKKQMESVLGGTPYIEQLNEYLHTYVENLPTSEKAYFSMANSIWVDEPEISVREEFLQTNADYYDADNYSRDVNGITDSVYGGALQVFLGEYAARSNTLRAALAEAAFMTGLERNGDIVRMAAYAPLFGNLTATHWSPDLIWFNNHQVTGSISYYMQKLFSTNAGTSLLDSGLNGAAIPQENLCGRVGVGAWYTTAAFDNVLVVDNATGKTLGEDKFSVNSLFWDWNKANDGEITVRNGQLINDATEMPYSLTGSVAYTGDSEWTDYTFTVDATKISGNEGFIIPFAVKDHDNCWFWNIGGWDNTVSCLQQIENGIKTNKIIDTVKPFAAEENRTYQLKVVVSGTVVKCYIDGELYVDYDTGSKAEAETYHVVSTDESGDVIVKIVNVTGEARTLAVNVGNARIEPSAKVMQVAGDSLANDNILGQPEDCKIEEMTVDGFSEEFNYTVPAYSATVIRLQQK